VISIRDPGTRPARVRRPAGLRDTLFLAFHDAEPTENLALPPEIRPMSPDDAEEIWNFVLRHKPHVGTIVCHCEQGMSRSPAVAAALAKALGEDSAVFFAEYQPNMFVYNLISGTVERLGDRA